MLLTPNFVYIHYPKTGGTFVTEILKKVHNNPEFGSLVDTTTAGTKHGQCRQIPPDHQHKPIVSTMRNPYDRYVSAYEFGWWKKYPESFFEDVNFVKQKYPYFPSLSFAEYLEAINSLCKFHTLETPNLDPDLSIGRQTQNFIKYFFNKPVEAIFAKFNREYIRSKDYLEDLFSVRFLNTETLNQDLYDLLLEFEYPQKDIQFILTADKIFPPEGGRSEEQNWQNYYTPELKEFVKLREMLLFSIFPEFDV
ncbi:MAG TPA: sulfotransferase family 2 domain-containing protein [Oscillatoriales cyanobacterium M59_W2019_021]|nr:sulfotransferase family 2 domain-containing protein [Oscillatoriales cyanobacterium M4454_W2019_049]HIK51556.1 sulfotransferase family 2 domain-containing protein [Oscillatoriales cyanobacterium M59_W2019_021]